MEAALMEAAQTRRPGCSWLPSAACPLVGSTHDGVRWARPVPEAPILEVVEFTEALFIPFLAAFAAGLLLVRKVVPGPGAQQWYLGVASVIFYGLWYPPGVVWVLLYAAIIRVLGEAIIDGDEWALATGVSLCLLILGVFKYFDFFMGVFAVDVRLKAALPLGISFYAFTAIGYLVDVRRDPSLRAKSYLDATLLISFWPHLAAGPILRARDVLVDSKQRVPWTGEVWALALLMIASGLVRKLLIADNIGAYVNWNIEQGLSALHPLEAWCTVIGFGAQIYADFSGYSDMAIGLALLLGYRLPANFNLPYRATSLREFWQRWHISLSSWFQRYVYLPLGGSRQGNTRTALNLMLVFLLSGFWHGAAWSFIIWGGIHGLALIVERALRASKLRVPTGVAWLATMSVVAVAWGFFRLNVSQAVALSGRLVGIGASTPLNALSPYYMAPILLILLLVVAEHVWPAYAVDERGYPVLPRARWPVVVVAALFPFALFFSGEKLPFIYFDF
jgi:D-alanyl-lipoteichoic acid acyltransferase DltB (MBOAT superfamily)